MLHKMLRTPHVDCNCEDPSHNTLQLPKSIKLSGKTNCPCNNKYSLGSCSRGSRMTAQSRPAKGSPMIKSESTLLTQPTCRPDTDEEEEIDLGSSSAAVTSMALIVEAHVSLRRASDRSPQSVRYSPPSTHLVTEDTGLLAFWTWNLKWPLGQGHLWHFARRLSLHKKTRVPFSKPFEV